MTVVNHVLLGTNDAQLLRKKYENLDLDFLVSVIRLGLFNLLWTEISGEQVRALANSQAIVALVVFKEELAQFH